MSARSDYEKRTLGAESQMALEALDQAIWSASVEVILQAEAFKLEGTLTPEKSHTLLLELLAQRVLHARLEGQVEEGTRAAHRIARVAEKDSVEAEKALAQRKHGRNRFVSRSRVA